jgi:hypothetical protein
MYIRADNEGTNANVTNNRNKRVNKNDSKVNYQIYLNVN